jgi:hypothetical protein
MVARKNKFDNITIRYVVTYGVDEYKEHQFYDYYEMMGDEKCDECGVYGWEECKSDCEYQARKQAEECVECGRNNPDLNNNGECEDCCDWRKLNDS